VAGTQICALPLVSVQNGGRPRDWQRKLQARNCRFDLRLGRLLACVGPPPGQPVKFNYKIFRLGALAWPPEIHECHVLYISANICIHRVTAQMFKTETVTENLGPKSL
jgi:hypothetical protein